ncbi:MAG: RNA polymerase sigma factor [Bryobacteraceae bacterium]
MEELYRVFSRGVRFYLHRQIGPQDLDDRLHEIFLVVAQAIRRGDLREPERLMGYVRTVVRRQVAAEIERASQTRRRYAEWDAVSSVPDGHGDPEEEAIQKQNQEFAYKTLQSISPRDREILVRFYLHQQSPERICHDMNLTETQFRLLKSRAKARFGEIGKRRIKRRLRFS